MKHFLWRVMCATIIFVFGACAGIIGDLLARTNERVGRVVEIIDYQDEAQEVGKNIRVELVDGSYVVYDLTEEPSITVLYKRGYIENPVVGKFYRIRVNGLNEVISIKASKISPDFRSKEKK